MSPFVPKRDDGVPEWKLVFDHIRDLPIGSVVTYADLDSILGRSFIGNRSPIYRAIAELRVERSRSMINVPGDGYRVLHPKEHREQANTYRRRSRSSLSTAVEVVKSTDMELLAPDERDPLRAYGLALVGLAQAMDYTHRRLHKIEQAHASVSVLVGSTEQKVNHMEAVLKAAGLMQESS
jgi:hypothetical protein